jgi:hypothetical protein
MIDFFAVHKFDMDELKWDFNILTNGKYVKGF